MAAEKAMELQFQVRQNATELSDFLKDLGDWETEIKRKDEQLQNSRIMNQQILPPIRNKGRRRKKQPKEISEKNHEKKGEKPSTRINSYDYRSWDKFDVDKVLQEMDEKEEMQTVLSESEDEEDSENIEEQYRLQKAVLEKERGNQCFKEGKYEEAVNCYTRGIALDPSNAILPANRAMALLKLNRFSAAESDCSLAISLNPTYTKAFARRAAAHFALGKLENSKADYEEVLKLEPNNKQAKEELKKIEKAQLQSKEKETNKKDEASTLSSRKFHKPPHLRSKKPLKRIFIEEIGESSEEESQPSTPRLQSNMTRQPSAQTISTAIVNGEMPSSTEPPVSTKSSTSRALETVAQSNDTRQESPPPSLTILTSKMNSPNHKMNSTRNGSGVKNTIKISKEIIPEDEKKVRIEDFPVPRSSVQFHSDWRKLQCSPQVMYQYLKKINPETYPKLFQQSLESAVLNQILGVLKSQYIVKKEPIYKELKYLAAVKRFGMAIMFLSASEKQIIQDLFRYMEDEPSNSGCPTVSDKNVLMAKYGITL